MTRKFRGLTGNIARAILMSLMRSSRKNPSRMRQPYDHSISMFDKCYAAFQQPARITRVVEESTRHCRLPPALRHDSGNRSRKNERELASFGTSDISFPIAESWSKRWSSSRSLHGYAVMRKDWRKWRTADVGAILRQALDGRTSPVNVRSDLARWLESNHRTRRRGSASCRERWRRQDLSTVPRVPVHTLG